MTVPKHAYVRPPSASYARALGQRPDEAPIDVGRARRQHMAYAAALRAAGLDVTELPAVEGHPDACFVQDVALFLPDLVVLGRPAEPSRQGEVALMREHLPPGHQVAEIESPGTLEWGDVLRIGDHLYVGQSARTNQAATEQLRDLLAPHGLAVEPMPVQEGLHLLSGVNYLGKPPDRPEAPGVLLAWETYADLPAFDELDVIHVPGAEAAAANCLALGRYVIVPAGYPGTAAAIWHRGFRVLSVPVSEFAKADGGVTCLSLPA